MTMFTCQMTCRWKLLTLQEKKWINKANWFEEAYWIEIWEVTDTSQNERLPSLIDSTNAITIYTRLKTVENPSQIPRADRCGIHMANIAHTNPAMAIQYGSFIPSSSLNRT